MEFRETTEGMGSSLMTDSNYFVSFNKCYGIILTHTIKNILNFKIY